MEERKVALITGGSRGIGKQVALKFAKEGYHIAINYVSDKTDTKTLEEELKAENSQIQVLLVKTDVTDYEAVEQFIKQIIETFGRIDVVVNNAGITRDNLLLRMSKEDFDKVIDVNLKGVFNISKIVTPYMMKKRQGSIINVSSVVGVSGNAGQCNYAASKAGLIGFTKSLAKELASRNIRVNAVAPGFIKTDMTDILTEEIKENINRQIPLKRMGTAEEVANVIYFLGTEQSAYITGQVIHIDGGMVM